jgi:hypothetical protein
MCADRNVLGSNERKLSILCEIQKMMRGIAVPAPFSLTRGSDLISNLGK